MTNSSHILARRYVTALLDAADEAPAKTGRGLQDDLHDLAAMIEKSADFRAVLTSPLLSVADQQRAAAAVLSAAKISDVVAGFVRVVIANRRGPHLGHFIHATLAEMEHRAGILRAQVDVATPLSDAHQKKLASVLSAWSGAKVMLDTRVANDVMAGLRVRVRDIQIDDTVAGKLARLKQKLVGA